MRDQAEPVHGHENEIDAYEGKPEMNFAERFIEAAAKEFREPKKERAQDRESRRNAHDQMEVAGDEIVADGSGREVVAREENSGESTGKEKRNKTEGKQHGSDEVDSCI